MLIGGDRQLNEHLAALLATGAEAVLATVVRTEGSTYRKTGARMLIPAVGEPIGLLSGGCLEDQIVKVSREVLRSGKPELLHFNLMGDEEHLVGYGKGCFGQLWIFLESIAPESFRVDDARRQILKHVTAATRQIGCAIVYEATAAAGAVPGARVLLDQDAGVTSSGIDNAAVAEKIAAVLKAGLTATKNFSDVLVEADRTWRFAVLYQRPPVDLVIFGAGPDAVPLSAFAAQLGWSVRIYDHRPAYVRAERFPGANVVSHYIPGQIAATVVAHPGSAVVVMTHNLLVDAEILRWSALHTGMSYVGLLGPAHRRERIFALLRDGGGDGADDVAALHAGRLHSPIGLNLGGDGPEAIALAIAAEVQAWHAGAKLAPR